MSETRLKIDADIVLRYRDTAKEDSLTVEDIECVWVWEDGSRDEMTYWAVADWITETFGNEIDWFAIKHWRCSPVDEESADA